MRLLLYPLRGILRVAKTLICLTATQRSLTLIRLLTTVVGKSRLWCALCQRMRVVVFLALTMLPLIMLRAMVWLSLFFILLRGLIRLMTLPRLSYFAKTLANVC